MNWVPFVLLVLVTIGSSISGKLIINHLPKIKALFVMYLFCSSFMFLFWVVFDGTFFTLRDLLTVSVGLAFLNYIGAQVQWSAYKINMSRTSLFLPLISLVAAVLFCVFLQEYKHINFMVLFGFMLHLVAIWLFRIGQAKKKTRAENKKEGSGNYNKWLLLAITLIVTNALILFFMKLLASGRLSDLSKTHFLLLWYVGSFFYFSLTLPFKKEPKVEPSKRKLFLLIPVAGMFAMASLLCNYWALKLNTGIAAVSFTALNSTFVPVVIGWVVFKEGKDVSRIELVGFLCGIAAAILIVTSH